MAKQLTLEQQKILESDKKKLVVSASAGSGKTFVLIEVLINLICNKNVPISKLLVLTFTKAAANEMRTRLYKAVLEQKPSEFLLSQLDEIIVSDICTIDSFCEKIIKRNVSKLQIDENFNILDEKASARLKLKAFNKTFNEFFQKDKLAFENIYFAFKRNKDEIFSFVLHVNNYLDSLTEDEREKILSNDFPSALAENYLLSLINSLSQCGLKKLDDAGNIPPEWEDYRNDLKSTFKMQDDFYQACNYYNQKNLPKLKRNKIDDEKKQLFVQARDNLAKIQEMTLYYKDISAGEIALIRQNQLKNDLSQFLKDFIECYYNEKAKVDGLDFADLEKYMGQLLKDSSLLKSLQEKYSYIFIDEYQDTNALQEGLIKPLAKYGNFVAVGDPKQGIYGFRNASMEIMNRDIEEFEIDSDADALFLTGNFRSNGKILDFINQIFEKLMTKESVNIDYKNTSRLQGLINFEKTDLPSVIVDIAVEDPVKKEAENKIYSVRDDPHSYEEKNVLEIKDIAYRIDEALNSEIYDAKLGRKRRVFPQDIALIFRSRSRLMRECVKFLQENGYSVIANIKDDFSDDSQVQVILSLLKLTLNLKDDIALASLMSSYFGNFSFDEIILFKGNSEKKFHENVLASEDRKVKDFLQMIEDFAFDVQVLGLKSALKKFFDEKNYDLYLNSLPDKLSKKNNISQLLSLAEEFDDTTSLINFIESGQGNNQTEQSSENAITVTTIHATKGLEFPIVILAGAGEALNKVYNKPFVVDSKFGIGNYVYDYRNSLRWPSPEFIADQHIRRQKEKESELMIFYVALTRAQNCLMIIGSKNNKNLYDDEKDNYLSFIFRALGKNFIKDNKISDYSFNIITQIDFCKSQKNIEVLSETRLKDYQKILSYIDFQYKGWEYCKINYKNSVTGILSLEEEKLMTPSSSISRSNAIERGLAYHEALKILDFSKISTLAQLDLQIDSKRDCFTNGYLDLIDKNILLKNILLLKNICGERHLCKEREFIMSISLRELFGYDSDNEVIVQGIVDLFSIDDGGVLVDYKYTSVEDDSVLVSRYFDQLKLYSKAIEKAYKIVPSKIYILSIKNAHLIEIKLK